MVLSSDNLFPLLFLTRSTNAFWVSFIIFLSICTSSFFSGLNGSSDPFDLPVVYTRLSTPNLLIASVKPNEAEITPIEPTIEDLAAKISSPMHESQ